MYTFVAGLIKIGSKRVTQQLHPNNKTIYVFLDAQGQINNHQKLVVMLSLMEKALYVKSSQGVWQ